MATSKKAAAAEQTETTGGDTPQLPKQYEGNVQQFLADCDATPRDQWPADWHKLYEHFSS